MVKCDAVDKVTLKISEYWKDHPEQQREKKKVFLQTLREHGTVRSAAESAHVDRRMVYSWREEDPEFRAAWDAAKEDANDKVKNSLFNMATSEKNVVASIFWLKNNCADYRDRITIDVQGLQRETEERMDLVHAKLEQRPRLSPASSKALINEVLGIRKPQETPETSHSETDPPLKS